jgi:hypothetical protein
MKKKISDLKKDNFNDEILIFTNEEIKPFYEELLTFRTNEINNKNNQIENIERELNNTQIEISEINNDTQITETHIKNKKRKRDLCICGKCSIIACNLCKDCCKIAKLKCNGHKQECGTEKINKIGIENYQLIINDFEFKKEINNCVIMDYSAIELKMDSNNGFEYVELINERVQPTKNLNFNEFAIKNISKYKTEDFETSILPFDFQNNLDMVFKKKLVLFSSSCTNEINCFKYLNSFLSECTVLEKLELENYKNLKEKLKNKNTEDSELTNEYILMKQKLLKKKEKSLDLFENRFCIFIDTGIFFPFLNNKNPKNQQDLYKFVFNNEKYSETHRSHEDNVDLFEIFKKYFKNDFNFFFLKFKNFLMNSTTGIYVMNNLNLNYK